jgi:hypothetical protein
MISREDNQKAWFAQPVPISHFAKCGFTIRRDNGWNQAKLVPGLNPQADPGSYFTHYERRRSSFHEGRVSEGLETSNREILKLRQ